MTPRRRTSFFVDDELSAGLKALKARDGTPEAEAIRRAIAEYLDRRGVRVVEKARPAVRANAPKGGKPRQQR
jgi:hypothetical protein